ncbi:MAG: hypothetical protein ACPG4Y_06010, partial [Chitinophagales bacterium]
MYFKIISFIFLFLLINLKNVNSQCSISINPLNPEICAFGNETLTASITGNDSAIMSYSWSGPNIISG